MESMPAPTYMHPGEDPNEVLARLVAYVNQEQQIDYHPVYGRSPNGYTPPEPAHPGPQTQYDASAHMMNRVLSGLRRLDTVDDPIAARRPAAPAQPPQPPQTDYYRPPVVPGPYDQPPAARRPIGRQPVAVAAPPVPRRTQAGIETAPMPIPRREARHNRQPTEPSWLADEVLDRKFAAFMKSWDDEFAQESQAPRHRRQASRLERITARIGLGLGVIATAATAVYAGLEFYSRARGH